MRTLIAALAFAGAFCSRVPSSADELTQVAQMARDVTGAVRKQRQEQRQRSRADDQARRGGKQ